jgi:inner membrane protein
MISLDAHPHGVTLSDQYQTVSLSGAAVQMDYCTIEGAISVLKDQYAVGTVTAKIISPRPKG